tara:strand:- start:19779 stop:21554 length:1776 start_codon:yes stop_codon:yes gene_type:complete
MKHLGITLISLVSLASCGAGGDDNPHATDAGSEGDGGVVVGCSLSLISSGNASVGQPIEMTALVEGSAFGIQEFTWSVDLGGAIQNITELADPVDRISFVPQEAGAYRVIVEGFVGSDSCTPAILNVGVVATGARIATYRMRVMAASGAPMQDVPVDIYGGADSVLPVTVLETGALASGQILDHEGAGVAAYVRARLLGAAAAADYEAFSDASGSFSIRLPEGRFDLLVVPQGSSAPAALFADRTAADVGTTLNLVAPTAISGRVLDAGGAGLPGARISLLVDGARSTEAVSAADGSFSVSATGTSLTGLSVAPPPSSGMPSLRAESLSGQSVDAASTVLIRFSNPSMAAAVDVTNSVGAALPGAHVEWRADLPSAGTVDLGTVETLSGTLRVEATADGTGRAQSALVARTSSLVVHASDGSEARILRDVPWATSPISSLSLETLAPVSLDADVLGSALSGATVEAAPIGLLAPQGNLTTATTAANGSASFALIPGGSYRLAVRHPTGGEQAQFLANAQAGSLGAVSLPGTILAQGQISIGSPTGSGAGAQVRLYCDDCTGADAERVHASAVADGTGRFKLRIADPGVDPI